MSLHHSVRLEELCRGCTNCLKTCPTEAIRVKNGKAFIIEERCIVCGSCGSPSCRSLAEDIVRGHARETDCVFRLKDRIRDLTEEMLKLEGIMPPGTDRS